jgi:hypothetical protein
VDNLSYAVIVVAVMVAISFTITNIRLDEDHKKIIAEIRKEREK